MVTSRIAVNMASASTPREERDALTEWVNIIAFSERTRHLLSQCAKGQMIAVTGNVTKEFYQTRSGERAESRTIIVEDMLSAAGSLQPNVAHPADMDDSIKNRLAEAASQAMPETKRTYCFRRRRRYCQTTGGYQRRPRGLRQSDRDRKAGTHPGVRSPRCRRCIRARQGKRRRQRY